MDKTHLVLSVNDFKNYYKYLYLSNQHPCQHILKFQWLVAGLWSSLYSPVTFTNETNLLDITDLLLNVALNTWNTYICTSRIITPISSSNKSDSHDITEILLKVELNTINSNPIHNFFSLLYYREKMTKMKYY